MDTRPSAVGGCCYFEYVDERRRRRDGLAVVIAPQMDAVEDGKGVDESMPGVVPAQTRHVAPELEANRRFDDLEPHTMSDSEQFDIERETFCEQPRDHALEEASTEHLQARLRVAQRQSEKQAHDRVIPVAQDASPRRIFHSRLRMPLASDNGVGAGREQNVKESRHLIGVQIEIGVEEHDEFARGVTRAARKRETLAFISLVTQDAYGGCAAHDGIGGEPPRLIAAAVVDDDDLQVRRMRRQRVDDCAKIRCDRERFVVSGNDDGDFLFEQKTFTSERRTTSYGGCNVLLCR